jgi:acyl-CoA synthetase (AMP-forming)/AMP-acid ligase II
MATAPTIVHAVREIAERSPDRELVAFRRLDGPVASGEDERLGYGDLWRRAATFAERLRGVGRGERVLLVMPLGRRLLEGHLGALLAGAVPVVHAHPSPKVEGRVYLGQLTHVIELSRPAAVITHAALAPPLSRAGLPAERICVEDELPESTTFTPTAWQEVDADAPAILQCSSGSTGLQKGVLLSHRMVIRQCQSYARAIRLSREDRICSWLPLYHDMGLFTTWLMPLLSGVPVAALDPFAWVNAPASFLRLIGDYRGTLAWQPNFAYNLLASRVTDTEIEGVDLGSMRGFSNCSEPVRARSHEAFYARFRGHGLRPEALWVCYAMAENAFAVTAAGSHTVPVVVCDADAAALARGVVEPAAEGAKSSPIASCGSAILDCEIKVVDEQRRALPEGRVGEIALRSPFSLRAYHGDPEATRRAIDDEGFYHTGDLGFLHEGQLFVTGRRKDLLILGGRNFYPQDVEAICDACAGAVPGRAVAVGAHDERAGTERLVILVESRLPEGDAQAALELEVRRRVFEELDCPVSEVHVVSHMWLQKTTSGKIARHPNLERFRAIEATRSATATRPNPAAAPAGWLEVVVWGAITALAIVVILALRANLSWGLYSGF